MSKNAHMQKFHIVTALSITIFLGIIGVFLEGFDKSSNANSADTDFVFLNLNGKTDSNYTPFTWNLIEKETVQVSVLNHLQFPDKFTIIENTVLESETLGMEEKNNFSVQSNMMYYIGWKGALDIAASNETPAPIPQEFEVLKSSKTGDITIILTNDTHEDNLSGTTKLLVNKNQNEIVHAEIIIYQVSKLSDNEFAAIMRHEFGHALGLGHSNDKNDIMYYQIQGENKYISDCNVSDIVLLYGGNEVIQTC